MWICVPRACFYREVHELLELLMIPAPSRQEVEDAYGRLAEGRATRKHRRVLAAFDRARAQIPGAVHELTWKLARVSFALDGIARSADDALFWGVVDPDDALRVAVQQSQLQAVLASNVIIEAASVLDEQVGPVLREICPPNEQRPAPDSPGRRR